MTSGSMRASWATGLTVAVMVALMSVLGAVPAGAQATPRPAPDRDDALNLLGESARAARTTAYSGTQFVSAWGDDGATATLVQVTHVPGRGTYMRTMRTGTEPAVASYTDDSDQQETPAGGLSGPSDEQLTLLRGNYSVVDAGRGSVVGRPARVVAVLRPDGSLAARFWIDRDTRLLLRREILDTRGRIVHATAFIDLSFGKVQIPRALSTPKPWGDRLGSRDLARLRSRGWVLPARLPGGLVLFDARERDDASHPVVHLGYSDGLTVVSVFVQPGRLDETRLRGWRKLDERRGTVYVCDTVQRRVTWSADGYVYTVFADASTETVDDVVAVLPHDRPPGFWVRVWRGLSRFASWMDPFS